MSNQNQKPNTTTTTTTQQSELRERKMQLEAKKRRMKNKKINNGLILGILVACLLVLGIFIYNIVVVANKTSSASGTTLTVEKASMKNDLYTIGNNPTSVQREYFQGLTDAIKENDPYKTTEFVVKSFISDYYTWTNKDGNYEVGGLAYIYGPKFTAFQEQARWEFYSDLDLYINQYGRDNLLEVTDIQTTEVVDNGGYTVDGTEYTSYYTEATWTYKSSKLDTSEFQSSGYFTVINRDGRFEIVSMYNAWDDSYNKDGTVGGDA